MDSASPFQPWTSDDSAKNVKSERDIVDDAKLHRENVNHPKHRQTASYDKESVPTSSSAPGTSGAVGSAADPTWGKESKMDSNKIASMQQIVENTLSQEGRQRVAQLLEAVEALGGAERLLLYLRLPTGVPPHDPLKQPMNPLGSRAELQQTVIWIQTHLEVDPDVSLPKQDVYDEYIAHCMSSNMKPLSTADFGKVMKQVYPTVRPRRLGTRGNSRYCYAGLRKKIKLEVPQLPDLGESSTKETTVPTRAEPERIICEWAENKLGIKCANISELARHLSTSSVPHPAPHPAPASVSPTPHLHQHVSGPPEDAASRQLMKHLKRKMQAQGTPGRPKKNKAPETSSEPPPSTSYAHHLPAGPAPAPCPAPAPAPPPLKHEGAGEHADTYAYTHAAYAHGYEGRAAYPPYPPPRHHAHPHALPHDYRADPYAFEPTYAARDLTLPSDPAVNLPINLSSDASLDLSTERGEWQRRRPPEPPPRLPLPGKKLILEAYHSETRAASPRTAPPPPPAPEPRAPPPQPPHPHPQPPPDEFPRAEYLPKKMRAAEILGGKLAATRHAAEAAAASGPPVVAAPAPVPVPAPVFLEDPKNLTSRSKSTAAALAREERQAASPTRSTRTTCETARDRRRRPEPRERGQASPRAPSPDCCCGLDGIAIKTGVICHERHSEILNRERVISICNIDKHDLDDYLNEGNSQEHEEELLQYFQQRAAQQAAQGQHGQDAVQDAQHRGHDPDPAARAFLEAGPDPQDDHSQGKNEKISQLRELLAKNLKNQSGSISQNVQSDQPSVQIPPGKASESTKPSLPDGSFEPLARAIETNGSGLSERIDVCDELCNNPVPHQNGTSVSYVDGPSQIISNVAPTHLYNGHHTEPQSPTTRTQQYDFVPISDGCHSPGNFNSKSPLGFGARGQSPSKVNKQIVMGGSLQTSPISHSTAASPFVSPRNTPVPRSRFCSRPIPKLNGRKRRNPLSLGVVDPCSKQFAVPNEQKFLGKCPIGGPGKYYQPMSAPPSPNILTSQYKVHNNMYPCVAGVPNGVNNLNLNFLPNAPFRDHMNGDHPLSADPLSNEVSQFFQESVVSYRSVHDGFRSQSVPLKQASLNNIGMLSYNNTPVGSVPPTPIPNEFCDFGNLADTCDISKAGLNPETLDKIYNAIDSSNDVLGTEAAQNLLNSNDALSNGCDPLPDQQILSDEQLTSLIPSGDDLLDRSSQFNQTFTNNGAPTDNVEDFLKRANSMEFDFTGLVTDKNKYYTSRSVPGTPLPFKRAAPNLQIDSRRSRELFAAENCSGTSNGISSKSVPSTPQFAEDRSVFSYSNRDFLINGNSVSGATPIHESVIENDQGLASPLHDNLEEILVDPLTPALLADLDKMDGAPYGDL